MYLKLGCREICDLDVALPVQQNILRLQVTMNHLGAAHRHQSLNDLLGDFQALLSHTAVIGWTVRAVGMLCTLLARLFVRVDTHEVLT